MSSLSILIPTLPIRIKYRERLYNQLKRQLDISQHVEIIIDPTERETIGSKRNRLLKQASNDYLCFIDDDDRIADNYLELIFEALKSDPDCCSLHGIITFDGQNPKHFWHSIQFQSMFEADGVYYRPPNHLNVVRSSIAKQMTFPDWNYSEDSNYCFQLRDSGLLNTEHWIEPVLYYYDHINDKKRHNYEII